MVENAATWLEKLESGLRPAEAAPLRRWLKDPLNRKAITEQCDLWHGPEVMVVLATLFPVDRYLGTKRPSRALLTAVSAAAAIAIVTVGTIGFLEHAPWAHTRGSLVSAEPFAHRMYSTKISERITVPLPDGTVIELNGGTRIVVEFGARTREVYLARGAAVHAEASFRVPKAQKRPFHVIIGPRTLKAADARFNLRRLTPETVEVTVIEGQVHVFSESLGVLEAESMGGNASVPGRMLVGPLETAIIGPGIESVHALDPADAAARIAWQRSLR